METVAYFESSIHGSAAIKNSNTPLTLVPLTLFKIFICLAGINWLGAEHHRQDSGVFVVGTMHC